MQGLPFLLVILSAIAHGYWNFLFKQARHKNAFLGLSKAAEPVLYALPFAFAVRADGLEPEMLWYVAVGTLLSVANYVCLAESYKRLDLTVAYPISRSSTIFIPFLALLFFDERIDAVGWISVLLITLGVVVIQFRSFRLEQFTAQVRGGGWGAGFALLAAFAVALYTLWGKEAVRHVPPFTYMYCYTLASNLYFFPALKRLDPGVVAMEWRLNKWRILAVSVFNTLSFVLLLFALTLGKVSYVGALRQLSLVFGAGLGWLVLREEFTLPRAMGTALIVIGACLTYAAR